jgi:uncharacterized membrane protein YjjB (DUF3815 family)
VKRRLTEIGEKRSGLSGAAQHVVFGLAGVFFGVLNNADIWTACSVFLSSTLISWLRTALTARKYNLFASTLAAAAAGVALSCVLVKFMPTMTPLVAVIAPVLPMIPGFPMINGGIDILRNHNSVGLARIAFAATMIGTLTLAISGPLVLFFGTLRNMAPALHGNSGMLLKDLIFGGGTALLLGLMFNAPRRLLWAFGAGGAVTLVIRTFCLLYMGADPASATFLAAAGITVITSVLSRRQLVPPVFFAVICVLIMTPGYLMVSGLNGSFALAKMASGDIPYELLVSTAHTLMRAGFIVCAMIAGVVFPNLILVGRSPRV